MKKKIFGLAVLAAILGFAVQAQAIPELQLYVDGSTYDPGTETWVTDTDSFTLWVIGDIGAKGDIDGVKLSAAVLTSEVGSGSISLSGTTASGITDPSASLAPTYNGLSTDGAVPELGDGSSLPSHGIYGPGVSFFEWSLGDFTLTDSPVGDFQYSFPTSFPSTGQINAYTVDITGFSGVHFDAYDHYYNKQGAKYVFVPPSHDAETGPPVPEPATMLLFGTGLVGLAGLSRMKKNRKH